MDILLIIVIILASVLGVVLIVSISSLFFVQKKYIKLKQQNEIDMEDAKVVHSSSLSTQAIFSIKPPKVEDVTYYHRLEEALIRDPASTARMAEGFHPHSMDETAHSLVVLFESHDRANLLLRQFIDLEMAKANEAEGPTTLFRRDSVASKIMRFYSKLIGQQYLMSVLWPNIRLVTLSDEFIELDRNRMKPEENLDSHIIAFQEVLANFLEAIVNSIPLCPPQLREICYHLNTRAIQHFPENNIKVLSGFIFLRFFTPAIISPHAHGIVDGELTPNQSRTLLLVAKVLQNMANGIPFGGKEQYMMPLNDFLTINTPLVQDFLTELSCEEPKSPLRAFSVSTDSKFAAVKILHTNLVRSFPRFKRDHYPDMYDKVQMLLRELVDGEGTFGKSKTIRRVSVTPLRAESTSTTTQPEYIPVQSVSLKAINVITPVVAATYQATTPRDESEFDAVFEDNDENDDEVGHEGEEYDENEDELIERNEENENSELTESMTISRSVSTIIALSGLPSTPSPSSPTGLLSKSRSGANLAKSKSGSNITYAPHIPKKRRNKNIPNERLYRPNSNTKLYSPPSTSSASSYSSYSSTTSSLTTSSLSLRTTSPIKARIPPPQSSLSSPPKPVRPISPKKVHPTVQTKLSPTVPRQSSPVTNSPTLSSLALKAHNNPRDQFTQLPFPSSYSSSSSSSFSQSHY